jgi:hypothetical protein
LNPFLVTAAKRKLSTFEVLLRCFQKWWDGLEFLTVNLDRPTQPDNHRERKPVDIFH